MAITGANDHLSSAGLTNWTPGEVVNKIKNFLGKEIKIFGGPQLDETRRRINKFYNFCSQSAAH